MKILIAQMLHETNTFSPVVTDLKRFHPGLEEPLSGKNAIEIFRGTLTGIGGFISICDEIKAEIICPIIASAEPSRPVQDEAFEFICRKILDGVSSGCDAIMLDLHGAMVTESYEDGEGELLKRIKTLAPEIPIAVSLDMHANLYDNIIKYSDVVAGYQTYPHIDMAETAKRAGKALIQMLHKKIKPTMVWGNAPMLPHVMRQSSEDFPNSELQAKAKQMEAAGALAVSVFVGFPHADITQAGLSVVVVTNNDVKQAEIWRDELLDFAWKNRADFVYQIEPLSQSVAKAKALAEKPGSGPVILLDHYDNTASGGTFDTTETLAEIIKQGLEDVAAFGIYDPEAVEKMCSLGQGKEITISLGGKIPMPSIPKQSKPLIVTGKIKTISNGLFPTTVEMGKGVIQNMGKTVVLSIKNIDIVVISNHMEPFDPGCFTTLGIDPKQKKFLMLKSRVHFRVGFKKMAKGIIECAGNGVCTSDYSILNFKKVRRPIYPLDNITNRN